MRNSLLVKAVILVCVHVTCCIAFMVARRPETSFLEDMDRRSHLGEMFISSGAPLTYIADRPLRSWSAFHGGERRWVRLLVLANAPALLVSSGVVERLWPLVAAYHEASWWRAKVFAIVSILQWLGGAYLWHLAASWSGRRAPSAAPN